MDMGTTPRRDSAAFVFQRLQFGNGLWHSATVFETNASFVTADADLSAVDIAAQRESSRTNPKPSGRGKRQCEEARR